MCLQLGRVLDRLGFEVTLVGPDGPGPAWVVRHGGTLPWQAARLRAIVRRMQPRPDLIVTVGPWGWPTPGPGRSSGSRWPPRVHVYVSTLLRVARYQGGHWHWRARWALAAGMAEALAARGATAVAVSQQTAEDARRLYRAKVDRVLTLGVDTDLFRPRAPDEARRRLALAPDRRYGLFVGRGEPGKGPDIALEACRRVGWELLAAGARPIEGSRALGVLPPEELAWAYAAADAVVLPTAHEGWSTVVGEALAAGVPAVTTPVGWARDLGRLVPAYRPFLVAREAGAVARALEGVASGEAGAAVAGGRALILADHTFAAFEGRWRELLSDMGVLPALPTPPAAAAGEPRRGAPPGG
jgi:glycosyltransferase involved in cell wall biosynthesis